MNFVEMVSIISSIASLITVGIGMGKFSQKVTDLEKSVDKHNNVIERVFRLEDNIGHTDIGVLKSEQKHQQEAIEELRKDVELCKKKLR